MLLLIDDLIDQNFKTYASLENLKNHFDDKNNLSLILSEPSAGLIRNQSLCLTERWLQDLRDSRHDILKIQSSFGARRVVSTDRNLTLPALLNPDCGHPDQDRRENIQASLREISISPWGVLLTSKNHDDILVNFYLANTSRDQQYGAFDVDIVKDFMQSFHTEVEQKNPALRAHWSGLAMFQYYLRQGYVETGLLNLGMCLLLLILFRLAFGTYKSGFLYLLTLILTFIPTYAGMAFFKAPIDVLSNSLSMMILIASLEDFVYLSYIRSRHPERNWRYAFRRMLVPSFFTSLTTAVGFGSLAGADLDIIRRFGLWAAFAAMFEWLMVFYFLPLLLEKAPRLRVWTSTENKLSFLRHLDALKKLNPPRWGAGLTLLILVLGLSRVGHLTISDTPQNVFPRSHPLRQAMNYSEATRGWQTEISLVFPEDNEEQNRLLIEKIAALPLVHALESPYAVEDYLTRDLPEPRRLYVQRAWKNSSAARRLIAPGDSQRRAILYLGDTDITAVNQLRAQSENICRGRCELAGTLVSYGEFGERVLRTFVDSLWLSLVLVAAVLIFLMLALRQKNPLPLLLSALWGPLMLLALFVIFQIPIFFVTSVFASILVGLAGDNTIQFIFGNSRSKSLSGSIARLEGATALLLFFMVGLTFTLFLSYFAPMKTLGLLMIAGFILTWIGDVVILKALLGQK